jgi:DNA modification methylase
MTSRVTNIPNYTKPTPSTVNGRWCSFGPYYAMFPVDFSLNTIAEYTKEDDWILDPFCGRGTVPFTAEMLNRHAVGIEISKLGWLYSNVKLNPAKKEDIIKRLYEIYNLSISKYSLAYKKYNEFFNTCYCKEVLNFLIAARENLYWKTRKIDRTLMSFIAIYSHGELGQTLSNQMQHVKACGPNYAIKWWNKNGYTPPELNPLEILLKKIEWRYARGHQVLGDSVKKISKKTLQNKKFKMLFTSPPYYRVTDYHLDQWIRLWLLGEEAEQKFNPDPNKNNFGNQVHYEQLLRNIFTKSKNFLDKDAVLYIRTDAREFSKQTTLNILTELFQDTKVIQTIEQPYFKRTQTALYGDKSLKPGECDIILTPK